MTKTSAFIQRFLLGLSAAGLAGCASLPLPDGLGQQTRSSLPEAPDFFTTRVANDVVELRALSIQGDDLGRLAAYARYRVAQIGKALGYQAMLIISEGAFERGPDSVDQSLVFRNGDFNSHLDGQVSLSSIVEQRSDYVYRARLIRYDYGRLVSATQRIDDILMGSVPQRP
jgi:hypothetical protein